MAVATVHRPGTPRAAFSHRAFRWVFLGAFASNIGTWMQNISLIAFADTLTGSGAFVGLITFAQLGPILFLSPFGGVIADTINRKTLMIGAAAVQGTLSLALAVVAHDPDPSKSLIVWCVLGIGIAGAINAPAAQATMPDLVGRQDLSGAVALNSMAMNASRVIGPLIAVLPFLSTPSTVFTVNAATYLFVIAAVALVDFDGRPHHGDRHEGPMERIAGGLHEARTNVVVGRALLIVALFSLFSLSFIYQMKGFSRIDLGLDSNDFAILFSCFGIGAVLGALSVGTRLSDRSPRQTVTVGLVGFAASLTVFALLTDPLAAYPVVGLCGFFYFVVITSLSTTIQVNVEDSHRGRIMGLWMMAWAGLVPVGNLIAGPVIDEVGHPPVMLFGAGVALVLAVVRLPAPTRAGETVAPPSPHT